MQTELIENEGLELKVFAFSVDIISFVKTIEKQNEGSRIELNSLLKAANDFYINYLHGEDAVGKYDKGSFFKDSVESAQECFNLLQTVKVEKQFLNEKADLIIEVSELIKKITRL